MCREKVGGVTTNPISSGSPLRVQGKVDTLPINTPPIRITPACAGKSAIYRTLQQFIEDHPCVCREKQTNMIGEKSKTGSPLRVQGKVITWYIRHRQIRITPACAGKSYFIRVFADKIQDHPCVCREKFGDIQFRECIGGSPLRVQGKDC